MLLQVTVVVRVDFLDSSPCGATQLIRAAMRSSRKRFAALERQADGREALVDGLELEGERVERGGVVAPGGEARLDARLTRLLVLGGAGS